MIKLLELSVDPAEAGDEQALRKIISTELSEAKKDFSGFRIVKRSVDARSRNVRMLLKVEIYFDEEIPFQRTPSFYFHQTSLSPPVIIIGAGPAGLFAALRLLEAGVKPIIIERGKTVRERRRDIAVLNRQHFVNADSNYCFGEGGAGTYSDGKLFTRSNKRGDVKKILDLLVHHGADENILVDAHPHIGTNKLPQIIERIRKTILNHGGEIHFETRLKDVVIENDCVKRIITQSVNDGSEKESDAGHLILATGHSARDIYELLSRKNILMEAKPFAMGVRIEHPQELIDGIQYHCRTHSEVKQKRKFLPAAPYSLVHQSGGRGVYSFCMCPGGVIAPCATAANEVVVNGWSPSKRNSPFANSGMVVAIELEDLKNFSAHGNLSGLHYQKEVEKMAFEAGGKTLAAPAQRMIDFVNGKLSASLPATSYHPGITSAPLHRLLPKEISTRLQDAFVAFGKKMNGYFTNDAVLHGVESRTSSPVRIPRNKETFEHLQVKGLYPVGEGAGYAGGIVSAAIDGQNAAQAIVKRVNITMRLQDEE